MMTTTTAQVWETFHTRLLHFIRAHIANDAQAEDILQDVFVTIHQRLPDLRDDTRLTAWLFQITRHAIADAYRQRQESPLPEDIADTLANTDDPPPGIYAALSSCVRGLLEDLAPADREALVRTEFAGQRQVALAREWGVSVSGAKSRVQRARAKLKTLLLDCCHLELNQRGIPIAYAPHCACCAGGACGAGA